MHLCWEQEITQLEVNIQSPDIFGSTTVKNKKIPKYYTCFIVLFFSNIFYSCTLHLMLAQRWQGYDFFLLGYARSCNFIMTGTICFLPLFTLEDVAGINPRNMSLPSFLCFSSSCFSIHFYSAMFQKLRKQACYGR